MEVHDPFRFAKTHFEKLFVHLVSVFAPDAFESRNGLAVCAMALEALGGEELTGRGCCWQGVAGADGAESEDRAGGGGSFESRRVVWFA